MKNPSAYAAEFMHNGALKSLRIIDAHAHMGPNYGTSLPISSAGDMVREMDRENIDCIFCAPHSALFDPGMANAEIERVMEVYPGRVYGYYTYNPNYDTGMWQGADRVLRMPGYLGFKFLPEYHKYALDGPGYEKPLQMADEHGLLVLVHTWGGSSFNSTRQVRGILERYHNLTLLMGHSAPGELDQAIELAARYENAYLDLCDIHRHAGVIDRMIAGAGAHKVLFGTDIPWYDPNYCLGSVLFSRISDADKANIIRYNALGLLNRVLISKGGSVHG